MGGDGNRPLCLLRKKEGGNNTQGRSERQTIYTYYILKKTFWPTKGEDSVTERGGVRTKREALQFS
jgi:hypothetical protein